MSGFTDELIVEEACTQCRTRSPVNPFPGEPRHSLPFAWNRYPTDPHRVEAEVVTHRSNGCQPGTADKGVRGLLDPCAKWDKA